MGAKYRIFILILIAIFFTSCCTKKDCTDGFDEKTISLIGFTQLESESIFLASYSKDDNYKTLIDSVTLFVGDFNINTDGSVDLPALIDFTAKADYMLEFKNLAKSYRITSITTELKKCNSCFLAKDYYTALSSYEVNGVKQSKLYFEISNN